MGLQGITMSPSAALASCFTLVMKPVTDVRRAKRHFVK